MTARDRARKKIRLTEELTDWGLNQWWHATDGFKHTVLDLAITHQQEIDKCS